MYFWEHVLTRSHYHVTAHPESHYCMGWLGLGKCQLSLMHVILAVVLADQYRSEGRIRSTESGGMCDSSYPLETSRLNRCPTVSAVPCPRGSVLDCSDQCADAAFLGDGWCDDGVRGARLSATLESSPPNFNCSGFLFDLNDCSQASNGSWHVLSPMK